MPINKSNYSTYLSRMTNSFQTSTKGLIPDIAADLLKDVEKPRILEVGFGSGVIGRRMRELMPGAEIVGIDIDEGNVKTMQDENIYTECLLEDFFHLSLPSSFHLIIFSSVIHELGSYAKEDRFTIRPILKKVFSHTAMLLKEGGYIIIRDGVMEEEEERKRVISFTAHDRDTVEALERFMIEFQGYSDAEGLVKPKCHVLWADREKEKYMISGPQWFIKEFCCTYTWGMSSWPREVQERFCYASEGEYREGMREEGIEVIGEPMLLPEEYPEYFSRFAEGLPEMNVIGLFVGQKR